MLSHLIASRLELRLDEADDLPVLLQQITHGYQDLNQGNETDVDGCKGCIFRKVIRLDITDIGFLHAHDTGIVPELPVQLSPSHVDRIDALRSVLKHTVRKAAGGASDIQAHLALHGHRKNLQRLLQLQAAAAHIAQLLTAQLNDRALIKGHARLIAAYAVDINYTGHNHRFCLFP